MSTEPGSTISPQRPSADQPLMRLQRTMLTMELAKTFGLFVVTALAEIVGCYLPYLWLKQGKSAWLLVPAAISLALFAWLLSLHPTASGRVYAAYGGVYIGVAVLWLSLVDKVTPTTTDWVGVGLCLLGMAVIMSGSRTAG
jgi:small multidrug resistance family-3 protein